MELPPDVAQEACRPSQPPSIKVAENMLRAVCGKQISYALAGVLGGAFN
jgi:hypothetical protein